MVRDIAAALLAALLLIDGEPARAAQVLSGDVEVVDGDTLRIAGETVRLHAIDAPEGGQTCRDADGRSWACGAAATEALRRLAADGLTCTGHSRDRFGRLVATCRDPSGADVAEALVRSGAAFAYARYGTDYVDAEKEALFAGRGVWQGDAERPSDVRAVQAAAPEAGAPPGCAIKGNISKGGRIYHVPGQEHYGATRISPARGERWFCSEAEAQAAGWRRARR
ncbi:MAG: thermonuclease family protein [Pseudomonadota bacterium]